MCAEPKVLWIDRNISLQMRDGDQSVLHCGEGVIERPPTTQKFASRQHCLLINRETLGKKENEALFDLLGVESWKNIDDESFNLNAASTFTEIVVSLENSFDKASLDDLFSDYSMAINAREFIGAGLKRSERWDNVQRKMLDYLQAKCAEKPENAGRLEEFGELLKKADGPEDVAQSLLRLRWQYANIYDRVELCQDKECRDYYERLSGEKLSGAFRKPSLTSDIYFEPKRKDHILGATLGASFGLRDEDRFSPGVDLSATAQIPGIARFTAGANIAYDGYNEDATKYGYITGKFGISGLVISQYAKFGLMPWGEGFSLDIGVRRETFSAEKQASIRQEDYLGNESVTESRKPFTTSSIIPEIGYTVHLTENLMTSTGLTIPTDKGEPPTLTVMFGIRHWFL